MKYVLMLASLPGVKLSLKLVAVGVVFIGVSSIVHL